MDKEAAAKEVLVRVKEEEAVAWEEVLRQGRGAIAFAPIVGKNPPINWGPPAMNSNVQNAAPP